MRILQFLKKEISHMLASPESVLLMVLFPIALTWILGSAFSGISSRIIDLPQIKVPVVAQGGMLDNMYIAQSKNAGLIASASSQEDVDRQLKEGSLKQYVTIADDAITLHTDQKNNMDSVLIRLYSRMFAAQASLAKQAIAKGRLDLLGAKPAQAVRIEGIDGKNEPSSFGYYGVTMVTMIILYGTMQTVGLLGMEVSNRTYLRIKASPFPMDKVFFVKIAAATLMLILQVILLLAFNRFVYHVQYRNIGAVLVIILPFILFSTGLGVLAYQLFRKEDTAIGVLNMLIFALVFTGGGYMMINEDSGFFAQLMRYSPAGWVNRGLFDYIYRGNWAQARQAMLWCGAIALLMIGAAYILFKREEGSDRVAGH